MDVSSRTSTSRRKRLIVIGAGFAGIHLVKQLRRAPVEIILVDRHNYHLFQPLLYQVATAALSPADIAYPVRRIFRSQSNVRVVLGQVDRIDLAKRQVCGGDGVRVDYDYLAVCVGATHSYFGKDDAWRTIAPGLKDLDDATEIRRRVLLAFEEAELEHDEASRRAKLTFVVVGGGPTGVEMAGALREIAAQDIQRDFRNIDTATTRIILVQGGARLLPQFDESLSERARRDLEAMGVEVRLNARVTNVDDTGVWIGGTEHLPAQNVVWAAGVAAPAVLATMGVSADRSGRINVGPDLAVPGHPDVFVLGDAANVTDAGGKPVPGLAPAAMQMGKFVGRIIRDELARGASGASSPPPPPRPAFRYRDKGIMATIGTHRAVADVRGWRFGGTLAWLMWSLIHVMFLIGFRNRIFVMAGWIYDYLLHGREARLITGAYQLRVRDPRRGEHVHVNVETVDRRQPLVPSPGTPGEG